MKEKLPFYGTVNDNRITRLGRRLLIKLLNTLNQKSSNFFTYHERPKYASSINTWPTLTTPQNVTIVMQGPIFEEFDYTFETLKLYKKILPSCKIILSTWKDTPREQLKQIEELGVEILLSEKPSDPGLFNINMQIVCTSSGVKKSHADGAQWIMKTRTDQRLHNPDVISYLIATATTFPVVSGTEQKHRIIGVGYGSLKYAPYHVTDQTLFGHADDMLLYWTPLLRPSPATSDKSKTAAELAAELFGDYTIIDLCKNASPEVYFAYNFLERLGRPLTWTLEDSWQAYRDHFCFVDYAATDFYWLKGQTMTLKEYTNRYDTIFNREEINFCQWLLLYSGQTPCETACKLNKNLEDQFNCEITRDPA